MLTMAGEESGRKKPSTAEFYQQQGKKSLTAWVPREMTVALKMLAAEKEMLLQDLIVQFLNEGLARSGKPRIE